jgi:hypothetical protein
VEGIAAIFELRHCCRLSALEETMSEEGERGQR